MSKKFDKKSIHRHLYCFASQRKLKNIKRARARLHETIQTLNQKLEAQETAESMMIHDVRNPITSIVSIAEMLRNSELPDFERKWIDKIHELGTKTLRLLKTTSDFVKIEKGTYELDLSDFDMIASLRTLIQESHHLTKKKSLQVKLYLQHQLIGENDHAPVIVNGDKFYIEQMLDNLITNAVEASPENQTVTICLEARKPLEIKIHNQGAIPENIREKLFEKHATFGKKTGQGLGAYIAQLIARAHQGSISFETSEQEGTTFMIILPQDKKPIS